MKKRTLSMSIGLVFALSTVSFAQLITTSPELPPDGVYVAEGLHSYPAMGIVLDELSFQPDVGTAVRTPLPGGDELAEFAAVFNANEIGFLNLGPITLNGGMAIITAGKVGNTTGTFPSEIIYTEALGSHPAVGQIYIQESPTLPSVGQKTITDIGGGLYQIDSFFDVYTELFNGAEWVPCAEPTRMTLVPEPASLSLIGLVAGGMFFVRRFFSA